MLLFVRTCISFFPEGLPAGLEAGAAINGPVILGLERNTGGRAASSTHSIIHLAFAALRAIATGSLLGIAASLATNRLVLETLLGIELLLASGEHEFLAALFAH